MKVILSHVHVAPFLGEQQMHIHLSASTFEQDSANVDSAEGSRSSGHASNRVGADGCAADRIELGTDEAFFPISMRPSSRGNVAISKMGSSSVSIVRLAKTQPIPRKYFNKSFKFCKSTGN
jgi:hypothetical protein